MSAGDNAAFDVHATDPARLMREVRKDLAQPVEKKIKYRGVAITVTDSKDFGWLAIFSGQEIRGTSENDAIDRAEAKIDEMKTKKVKK